MQENIFTSSTNNTLKVFCDGGARGNPGPAASAFVIKDENDNVVFQNAQKLGETTNNVAEYTGVKMALEWLVENYPNNTKIEFYLDSQLVASQLSGIYKIKNEDLKKLAIAIKNMETKISGPITYTHIPREKNKAADTLVNRALDNLPIL